jgi:hypothetical protein
LRSLLVVDDAVGQIYQPEAVINDLEFAVGGSTSWTAVRWPTSRLSVLLR